MIVGNTHQSMNMAHVPCCTTISSVPTIQTYTCSGEEQVEDEGNDLNTMYNHQVMKRSDKDTLKQAMSRNMEHF